MYDFEMDGRSAKRGEAKVPVILDRWPCSNNGFMRLVLPVAERHHCAETTHRLLLVRSKTFGSVKCEDADRIATGGTKSQLAQKQHALSYVCSRGHPGYVASMLDPSKANLAAKTI